MNDKNQAANYVNIRQIRKTFGQKKSFIRVNLSAYVFDYAIFATVYGCHRDT